MSHFPKKNLPQTMLVTINPKYKQNTNNIYKQTESHQTQTF